MKPMEGIKVVELSTMLAGPMTARILAEWGADVIKVESMNGDAWREQAGTSLSPEPRRPTPISTCRTSTNASSPSTCGRRKEKRP